MYGPLYLTESDGTKVKLPACSPEWSPSAFWVNACLFDPVGPICRRHREFFRKRKVANASQ